MGKTFVQHGHKPQKHMQNVSSFNSTPMPYWPAHQGSEEWGLGRTWACLIYPISQEMLMNFTSMILIAHYIKERPGFQIWRSSMLLFPRHLLASHLCELANGMHTLCHPLNMVFDLLSSRLLAVSQLTRSLVLISLCWMIGVNSVSLYRCDCCFLDETQGMGSVIKCKSAIAIVAKLWYMHISCLWFLRKVRAPIPPRYAGSNTVYYKDIGGFQILYSQDIL
jgi:hypothetical protein